MSEDLLSFLNGRITELSKIREEYDADGDHSMDQYMAGAIEAYELIRMKLEDDE